MRVFILIVALLLAGCEKYRENPDFPFPEFNKGEDHTVVCPKPPIRKTLTCTEVSE